MLFMIHNTQPAQANLDSFHEMINYCALGPGQTYALIKLSVGALLKCN